MRKLRWWVMVLWAVPAFAFAQTTAPDVTQPIRERSRPPRPPATETDSHLQGLEMPVDDTAPVTVRGAMRPSEEPPGVGNRIVVRDNFNPELRNSATRLP